MKPDDENLRLWLDQKGPIPLDGRGRFDRARWAQVKRQAAVAQTRQWPWPWAAAAALLALLMVWQPWHGQIRSGSPTPTPVSQTVAAPQMDIARTQKLGQVAYVNAQGLWAVTPSGLVHITSDRRASHPAWSADGRYLAYETAGPYGSHPQVTVYDVLSRQRIFHGSLGSGFSWQPGTDRLLVDTARHTILMTIPSRRVVGMLPPVDVSGQAVWSPGGHWLVYSITVGTGAGRFDEMMRVGVSTSGFGSPVRLFRSGQGSGLIPAGVFPGGTPVLYWSDPQYSASLAADGLPLQVWTPGKPPQSLSAMLPHVDYLAFGSPSRWAYMAGGPRTISGGKSVIVVSHGHPHTLPAPKGLEAVEPSMNARGQIAAVLAEDQVGAAGNLQSAGYRRWVGTRRLAVWTQGRWQTWSRAGRGVTDPKWAPHGAGILYLERNWLWLIANRRSRPVPLLGPIPSTEGFYGEITQTALWSLYPRP